MISIKYLHRFTSISISIQYIRYRQYLPKNKKSPAKIAGRIYSLYHPKRHNKDDLSSMSSNARQTEKPTCRYRLSIALQKGDFPTNSLSCLSAL